MDNGSSDNTLDLTKEYIHVLANIKIATSQAGTIAGVRMDGFKHSRGDIIAFLDADSVAPDNWLTTGVLFLSKDDKISCVGFSMEPPCENSSWIEKTWYAMSSGSKWKGGRKVRWLSTFNLMVKRDIFEKVGGFDRTLVTCEDADLGYRLSSISDLIYSDQIHVKHLGSVKGLVEFFRKEMWRGQSNLTYFLRTKDKRENFSSIFVPICYTTCLLVFFGSVLVRLYSGTENWIIAASGFVSFILPIALAIRAGIRRITQFVQTTMLYVVYLVARGLSIVAR
jgi:GT2 family glycosyltransferase